jgi:hypothetical protein
MKRILAKLGNLKFTCTLLILAMGLVFFSTLQQVDWGIHEVQQRYFARWIAWMPVPGFPGFSFPILGGYGLGALFLLNLCAGLPRVFGRHKLGLMAIHLGLLVLIISGFVSAYYQEESQMWIPLNEKRFSSESTYDNEYALLDITDPHEAIVYALPVEALVLGQTFSDPSLPFSFKLKALYPNAAIAPRQSFNVELPQMATQGAGAKMDLRAQPIPLTFQENERNAVTAYLEIFTGEVSLGTWLLSNLIDERFPPQRFTHEGRMYEVALRFKKFYLPFALKLEKFTHEVYPGTEIPKHFESVLWLEEGANQGRRVEISMNQPLRHQGYTFYQASFAAQGEATMLQVVKNPGWLGPYIGVIAIALGLVWHFMVRLRRHTSSLK